MSRYIFHSSSTHQENYVVLLNNRCRPMLWTPQSGDQLSCGQHRDGNIRPAACPGCVSDLPPMQRATCFHLRCSERAREVLEVAMRVPTLAILGDLLGDAPREVAREKIIANLQERPFGVVVLLVALVGLVPGISSRPRRSGGPSRSPRFCDLVSRLKEAGCFLLRGMLGPHGSNSEVGPSVSAVRLSGPSRPRAAQIVRT